MTDSPEQPEAYTSTRNLGATYDELTKITLEEPSKRDNKLSPSTASLNFSGNLRSPKEKERERENHSRDSKGHQP